MQKIIPNLWFDHNAEDAAQFYVSVFGGSVGTKTFYTEAGHEVHGMEAGTVLTVSFEVRGFTLVGVNGGPAFKLNPAISFMVSCESAEEVNELYKKLSAGGTILMPLDTYPFSERYAWVEDKYGVSWQIIKGTGPKIMPSLLFTQDLAGNAEAAMNYYTSVFKDSSMGMIARYGAGQPQEKEGTVMYGDFTIAGQKFAAMDSASSHQFKFNEAVSLLVDCETQEEIDYFWEKLSAVAESEQCGWAKDQFGVSWQIAPNSKMEAMLTDPDQEKAKRAMNAMMGMKKLDIAALEAAFNGN